MKNEHSEYSMLRSGAEPEKLLISSILDTTERNIRAMCRAMQVYEIHACDRMDNLANDYQDVTAVFAAFYDYVDGKMDILSELSRELESGLRWVSLEKLRASEDFRQKPLDREVFVSEEAYFSYCANNGFTPVARSGQNDATGS